ncbi:MAG TPA: hypothetical protein VD994_07720 [Prosthecobacter sp.]|nr:hypothetical protein [Prosthecobacter sp.]
MTSTTSSETQHDNLRMYVNDAAAMAKHIENAFGQQLEDDDLRSHAAAHQLIERMHRTLAAQRRGMEKYVEEFGGGVGATLKEAVTSITGALTGLYATVRKHPISRMLRDNYTALALACIAYEMLHTTALAIGQKSLADTALKNLRELAPLITAVTEVAPGVVLQELAGDDPSIDLSVEQQARQNALSAWQQPGPAK